MVKVYHLLGYKKGDYDFQDKENPSRRITGSFLRIYVAAEAVNVVGKIAKEFKCDINSVTPDMLDPLIDTDVMVSFNEYAKVEDINSL